MSGFLQKIAHNNRVSLGPKDIKALAELISSEKKVIEATQRLSTERTKASAALKEWGASEGADLGDILGKMSQLFDYISSAETAFAQHDANFRLTFKSIRTKEEHLASLKRSKDSLASKIDGQERKVSKMKEENKDLPAATVKLHELKQEMVGLENTVMNEETSLSDYKRSSTREALSLKLGALLELSEKSVIIGEIGKLIVDELPTDRTPPGGVRAAYRAFDRTEVHMNEAFRCLGEVVFNPTPLSPAQTDERRGGSNEEDPRSPNTYEPHSDSYPDSYPAQTDSYAPQAEAYQQQSYSSQQLSTATYGSSYGDYSGNGQGQEREREEQGPSGYGYQQDSYQAPNKSLAPATLPTIRTSSPMGEMEQELSTPTGEYNPRESEYNPRASEYNVPTTPTTSAARHQTLLTNVSRGYDDDPANRSSLAYMDDDADDYEQRQADEEAAERRREDLKAEADAAERKVAASLPSLPLPGAYGDPPGASSPASQYTEAADEFRRSSDVSNVGTTDTIPAPSSAFAAIRPTKPGMIRGESALGSKHGDIYVAGTNGAAAVTAQPPAAGPFQGAGTSGYNSRAGGAGDASSVGSGGGSARVTAGAFRRFAPQTQFSLPPAPPGESRYPTQADAIRDQYYSSANASANANAESVSPRGTVVDPGPRFDVSPLHVMKRQERNFPAPQRAGSVPLYSSGSSTTAHAPEDWRPQESNDYHAPTSSGEVLTSPPLPVPPPSYAGHSPGTGFQASQFVTKLD